MHTQLPSVVDGLVLCFVFVYGLVFGSFLNVVGYRLPRGESLVRPGSHCPVCQRRLRWFELVPVFSWLMLRGRCRTCSAPISLWYPLIELTTGCLFAATYLRLPLGDWPQMLAWGAFWLLLMASVATDASSMRIPDVLTLPGAVLMLIASGALRIQGWWWAFVGALVCGGGMFLIHLFARGQMGLGDVKLFLSIGAMLGAVGGLESLVLAALYGTCIGVFLRVLRRVSKREPIPFGPFIAMGAITVAVYGSEITRWYVGLVTPFG